MNKQSWHTPALEVLGTVAQAQSGPDIFPPEDVNSYASGPR